MSAGEWVYGIHAVVTALKSDTVDSLWCDQSRHDKRMAQILKLATEHNISIKQVTRRELEQLLSQGGQKSHKSPQENKHQGVVAKLKTTPARDESYLFQLLQTLDQTPLILALDGVQDPHNLGACLRSADAAGVHAVIAPRDRSVALTPTVRKVACGAAESVPFIQVTNLVRTLEQLKQQGLWTLGADGMADQTLFEHDLKGPVVLVLGAEGSGLRRLTKEKCDFLVRLPMAGVVESLNVSVATGICLFEAVRQRGDRP